MRTMFDGINADATAIKAVFKPGNLVAGYVHPSSFAWTTAEWGLFPVLSRVTITPSAGTVADVLDVENGDATPGETEAWITLCKAHGLLRPTIYCSLSVVPAVRKGTGKWRLGIDYDLWVADWDGTTQIPYPAAAAKQFRNTPKYDVNAVFDDGWPHRLPLPVQTHTLPVTFPLVDKADHYVISVSAIVGGKAQPVATVRYP